MEFLATGRIRTSHGVRGYMKALTFSGEREHLFSLKRLTLRKNGKETSFNVEEVKPFGDELLIKLQGIDSPEAAKVWSGSEIVVPRDKAAPLHKGEFYMSDLIGLAVECNGSTVGTLTAYFDGPASGLVELTLQEDGRKVLVPFEEEFVGTPDFKKGSIELKEDWFLS